MYSLNWINRIRAWELDHIAQHFWPGAHILEIGAGTGQQALDLSARGFVVTAIDLSNSVHRESRVFPIVNYDGACIPFPDRSFDLVFSSNVLEHVTDLSQMHSEIKRVLKPKGRAIHVLPTHSWRFWTMLDAFLYALKQIKTLQSEVLLRTPVTRSELRRLRKAWGMVGERICEPFRQHRHGARGSLISEIWLFHPNCWRRNFRQNGFLIEREAPLGLFYTGNLVFGRRLSMAARERLAQYFGSACHVFVLKAATGTSVHEIAG
jgi:SAM-dependent methyltransferase